MNSINVMAANEQADTATVQARSQRCASRPGPAWIAQDGTRVTTRFSRMATGWQCAVFHNGEIALIHEVVAGMSAAATVNGALWLLREFVAADMPHAPRSVYIY